MFYQKKNNKLEPLTGSTLYAETPIGTVIASFLAVAPSGYIKADDTVYTKAQYPELYERIPDVFKDTVNETFTIDLREVALKGIGLSSLTSNHYSNTGLTLGEFIEDRLQDHRHDLKVSDTTLVNYKYVTVNTGSTGVGTLVSRGTDNRNLAAYEIYSGRHGDTTEVKSVGVNYFVKAKHVALPIDIMDAISEIYITKVEVEENYVRKIGATSTSSTKIDDFPSSVTDVQLEEGWYYGTNKDSTIVSNGSLFDGSGRIIASFYGPTNIYSGFRVYLLAGTYRYKGTNAALYKLEV